jgi:hypothetical protein
MKAIIAALLEKIAGELSGLPDVFSTVQWGGRAYKLPGVSGSTKKPKLLAHVCLDKSGEAVWVDFKLARERAGQAVAEFSWIKPHSFRTLAPAGWISARVSTRSQCRKLVPLLIESRSLHPAIKPPPTAVSASAGDASKRGADAAERIDRVMRQKRSEGWRPRND